jgi:hypothetical protein
MNTVGDSPRMFVVGAMYGILGTTRQQYRAAIEFGEVHPMFDLGRFPKLFFALAMFFIPPQSFADAEEEKETHASLLEQLMAIPAQGSENPNWLKPNKDLGDPILLTKRIVALNPSPETWKAIERKWLELSEHAPPPDNWYAMCTSMFTLVKALSQQESPNRKISTRLINIFNEQALLMEQRGMHSFRNEQYTPLVRKRNLTFPQFAVHLLAVRFYIGAHGELWFGGADFSGFDPDRFYEASFLDAHREEIFPYLLEWFEREGLQGAGVILGYYKEKKALAPLKRWLLQKEGVSTEHGWHAPMHLKGFKCPSHSGYMQAIEGITGKGLLKSLEFNPAQIDLLRERVKRFPVTLSKPYGNYTWRLAVTFLYAGAPEIALEDFGKLYRDWGPSNRYLWQEVLPTVLPQGLSHKKLVALLGPPDRVVPMETYSSLDRNGRDSDREAEDLGSRAAGLFCGWDWMLEWDNRVSESTVRYKLLKHDDFYSSAIMRQGKLVAFTDTFHFDWQDLVYQDCIHDAERFVRFVLEGLQSEDDSNRLAAFYLLRQAADISAKPSSEKGATPGILELVSVEYCVDELIPALESLSGVPELHHRIPWVIRDLEKCYDLVPVE